MQTIYRYLHIRLFSAVVFYSVSQLTIFIAIIRRNYLAKTFKVGKRLCKMRMSYVSERWTTHQEKGKTAKHQLEIERFRSDEDKPWNVRSNKQKAGSSAGPLTAILERLEHFCGNCRASSASHRDR